MVTKFVSRPQPSLGHLGLPHRCASSAIASGPCAWCRRTDRPALRRQVRTSCAPPSGPVCLLEVHDVDAVSLAEEVLFIFVFSAVSDGRNGPPASRRSFMLTDVDKTS